MSFLKIKDPAKRDAMVKEYLELKKNIRDNLLPERTGEMELQADLSKFYKPITETQKATAREITEGIKKLPQVMQPTDEEEEEEEEEESIGEIARKYLNTSENKRDKTFGIRKIGDDHYIGNKHVIIKDNNIHIPEDGISIEGTEGLWGLITYKTPFKHIKWNEDDMVKYINLMKITNSLFKKYDPTQDSYGGNSIGRKWNQILSHIWFGEEDKIIYKHEPEKKNSLVDLNNHHHINHIKPRYHNRGQGLRERELSLFRVILMHY